MTRVHTQNVAVLAVVLAVLTLAATPVAVVASPGDTTTGTTIGDQLDGEGDTSDDSSGDSSTDDSTTSGDSTDDSTSDSTTSDDSTDDSTSDSSGETDSSTEDSSSSDDTSTDDSSTDDSTDDSTRELSDTNVTATTDAVLTDSVTGALSGTTDATGSLTGSDDDATAAGSPDSLAVQTLDADVFGTTTDATSTDLTGTVDGTTDTLVGETGTVFDAISASGTTTTTSFEPSRLQSVPEATQAFDEQSATRLTFGGASAPGSTPLPPAPTTGLALGAGALAAAGATRTGALAPSTLAALGSNLGATVAAGVAPLAGRTGMFDRLLRMLAPFRYSRYDDSDPLEHDARADVYEVVNDAPGAYLSEVAEEADLPLSTARHHVRVLEREDLLSGAKVRGKRRFYPAYTQGIELAAALNDEATAAVIDAVSRLGAASVSDLADELGRDPSTVSHHLKRLAEDDIVVRERDGRAVVNTLSPEARTALEPEQDSPAAEAGEAMASD